MSFQGQKVLELTLLRVASAHSDGETVVVTLPVSLPGTHPDGTDIRVAMSIEDAEPFADQLQTALKAARVRARGGW